MANMAHRKLRRMQAVRLLIERGIMDNNLNARRPRKLRFVIDNDGNHKPIKRPTRPTCTRCGREMIQTHITAGNKTFIGWLCDCVPQPETIATDIVRAREWDDEVIFYTIEYNTGQDDDE